MIAATWQGGDVLGREGPTRQSGDLHCRVARAKWTPTRQGVRLHGRVPADIAGDVLHERKAVSTISFAI